MPMDELFLKPCLFIASTGRTGTQFFGQMGQKIIPDCNAYHEPDVLWIDRPREWIPKIRQFGWFRMTWGRYLPRYSLRMLSIARQSGRIDDARAIDSIRAMRRDLLRNLRAAIFLEANGQYSGLLDLLPQAFPNSKAAYIIRDPRDWVRSFMNMRVPFYSWRDIKSWFGIGRLTPAHIAHDPNRERWPMMSLFEKLCWAWNRENRYALECAKLSANIQVFRFEDLFDGQNYWQAMRAMLEFLTRFDNGYTVSFQLDPDLLAVRVHSRREAGSFPAWSEWTPEQAKILTSHCGDLMTRFRYGGEPDWLAKVHE
jgi:hypothetical protein